MEFRVLGPLEVSRDGRRVELGPPRQRAVLGRLLMAGGRVVAADRIIDDLWSGEPPPKAMGVLQAHISTLRRVLEPDRQPRADASVLVTRAPGYALLGGTDAGEFEELLTAGIADLEAGHAAGALGALDAALGLWRGEPYADLIDEPWLEPEVARLRELRLVAREHQAAARISTGAVHAAIPELEALVADHPFREGLWRLLVLALYRTGRQGDALAALRRARRQLSDDLGVDPSPTLRDLEAAVLGQQADLGVALTPVAAVVPVPVPRAESSALLLVGRAGALEELNSAASGASAGVPRFALVTGEPGIGKTWLCEAFAAQRQAAGWTVAWGRCHDASGAPALWPWLEILRSLEDARPLPDELRVLLDGTAQGHAAAAADARFHQHHAIARYLSAVGSLTPALVVLDDVQWADAATLSLIGDLPNLMQSGRVLFLGTSRAVIANSELQQTLARLGRHDVSRIALGALDVDAVAELVEATGTGVDPASLLTRTGGNPFLLRETLRTASSHGPALALTSVPETAADLLRQRMVAFPPEVHTVLQAAAVIGRVVDIDLLIDVSGQTEDDVLDALDVATLGGILMHETDRGLRFSHDLMRETLYGDIAPLRRARLHARIASMLAPRPGADVTTVAMHAVTAGPTAGADAVRWASAAADQAAGRLGFDDQVRWLRAALRAASQQSSGDPVVTVDLLLRLLRAQLNAGYAMAALETRSEAIRAADLTDDVGWQLRALVALDQPTLWIMGRYDDVDLRIVERLERASDLQGVEPAMRARILATLANELFYSPGVDRMRYALEAVKIAREVGDPALVGFVLNAQYLALRPGLEADAGDIDAIARDLFDLDRAYRLPAFGLLGHLMLMPANLIRFDVASADLHAAEAAQLTRRLALSLPLLQHRLWTANRVMLDGRLDEARRVLGEIGSTMTATTWWDARPLIAATMLCHLLQADRLAEAGDVLPLVAKVHPAMAHDAELLMLISQGRPAEALRRGRDDEWPPIDEGWLRSAAICVRAAAAAACGDEALRRDTFDVLAPFSGLMSTTGSVDTGPVDYYLGLLARANGNEAAATAYFTQMEMQSTQAGLEWTAERARAASQSGARLVP